MLVLFSDYYDSINIQLRISQNKDNQLVFIILRFHGRTGLRMEVFWSIEDFRG